METYLGDLQQHQQAYRGVHMGCLQCQVLAVVEIGIGRLDRFNMYGQLLAPAVSLGDGNVCTSAVLVGIDLICLGSASC